LETDEVNKWDGFLECNLLNPKPEEVIVEKKLERGEIYLNSGNYGKEF